MKKLLLIVLALGSFSLNAQKWGSEFGLNYNYANPIGGMGRIIERGHGVSLNYGFVRPDQRLALGAELTFAQYGRDRSRQEYTFDDGSVAPMDIIVSNSFINVMVYSRFYVLKQGPIRPFLTGKVGYSRFSTNLNIYDPDDNDHCEPVENDVLSSDGTMVGTLGAGAKIDFASVFKRLDAGRFYFETSFNLTQGGQVRYMNTDATRQHGAPTDADHVMAEFINTETQVVHRHHVGYLYRNPVQMTELRFGVSMNISR